MMNNELLERVAKVIWESRYSIGDDSLTIARKILAELAGELRDSERYAWLRSHGYKNSIGNNPCVMCGAGINPTMPEILDKAIDEARGE